MHTSVHFQWYLHIPSHEKAFQSQLIASFCPVADKSENYRRKLAAMTQNGPRITDLSKFWIM